MIHVIAVVTAKPGQRDAVLAQFRKNIPNVLAEEGCIEYAPVIDVAGAGKIQTPLGPDRFMVIEKWSSAETLRAHGSSPHMAAYAAAVKDLLADRVIHVLTSAA